MLPALFAGMRRRHMTPFHLFWLLVGLSCAGLLALLVAGVIISRRHLPDLYDDKE